MYARGFTRGDYFRPSIYLSSLNALIYLLVFTLIALASGCGGSGGSKDPPPQAPSIAAPSNLVYPYASVHVVVGEPIPTDTPTVSGTVSSYRITPALSAGLSMDPVTGTVSGTPLNFSVSGTYTVTARNSSGSTSTTINILVDMPESSALRYSQLAIRALVGQEIIPDVPTGTIGMAASFTVSPALPAGLVLNPSTGVISGTPGAAASSLPYVMTAQTSGGSMKASILISVLAVHVLLDLGHASPIQTIRETGDRILSVDQTGHWVLWDYASDMPLASADGSTNPEYSTVDEGVWPVKQIDMAGQTFVVAIPYGFEVRSNVDGHLVSVVPSAGLNQEYVGSKHAPWWQLASDGSYVCVGSDSRLTVYSLDGSVIASKPGDYSGANSFSAPGNVLVALGPAGQSVIETISVTDGTSTVSPPFSGTFNSWFLDGARFLTNLENTVWEYSNGAVQQAVVGLPTVENLTGQGNWIWTYQAKTPGYPLDVYAIGADTPTLSYAGSAGSAVVPSGTTIGYLSYGAGEVTVFDLSGSMPLQTDFSVPIAYLDAYAGSSGSQWMVGNLHGALFHGASLSSTPRFFGYGDAWSIAGSSINAAVSTASGRTLIFNSSPATLDQTIDFSSGKVALSADGTILGASANANDAQYEPDRTLNFYSLPSGGIIKSYPYTYQDGQPALLDFTLASSGETIAQITGTWQNPQWTFARQVTPLTGGSAIWSDTPATVGIAGFVDPVLLSPDGTLIAVYTGDPNQNTTTSIIKNGTLVTAAPGAGIGWIDNNRLLTDQYVLASGITSCSGATIYDSSGKIVAASLPCLYSIQTVTPDQVYDRAGNAIYSLSTGQPVWTGSLPTSWSGAVFGSHIIYQSGHNLVMETY